MVSRRRDRNAEMEELLDKWVSWAENCDGVRAAFVVGSRARTDRPADDFSDLDIVFFCTDPDSYVMDDGWLREIGEPVLSFMEPTASGAETERRVLFEPDLDVDFVPLSVKLIGELERTPADEAARRLAGKPGFTRGCRVVLDKDGLLASLSRFPASLEEKKPPTEGDYLQVVNKFLYSALWTARKLRRGELWVAKRCLDSRMNARCLLKVIEWHAKAVKGGGCDTWHEGRFIESWAAPEAVNRLGSASAAYDPKDVEGALKASLDLFCELAREVGERRRFPYPSAAEGIVRHLIEETLSRPRGKVK